MAQTSLARYLRADRPVRGCHAQRIHGAGEGHVEEDRIVEGRAGEDCVSEIRAGQGSRR